MLADERQKFVEVRVFVAENQKPSDLSLVTGSLTVLPKGKTPVRKDFQLMMPDPGQPSPAGEPLHLPDGHEIRLAIMTFPGPFSSKVTPGGGTPSVYFKVDLPADLARKDTAATLELQFPSGKQKLELGSIFEKNS